MSINLNAIEWRERRATPGPWECDGFADGDIVNLALFEGTNRGRVIAGGIETHTDADFLLNARTDVPALLAYARDLEARLGLIANQANAAEMLCRVSGADPDRAVVPAGAIRAALAATDAS